MFAPEGTRAAAFPAKGMWFVMTATDPLQVLRRVTFFESLTEDERRRLEALLHRVSFETGETIVSEGDSGDRWFVLTEGMVVVERADLIGQNVTLAVLGPGESFGESALLAEQTRVATVRSLTPVQGYALDRADVRSAEAAVPAIGQRLRRRLDLLTLDKTLKRASPFARLPDDVVWSLARQLETRIARAGDTVVTEGDEADRFYLVRSGRLEVRHSAKRLAILQGGDFFGEVAILTGGRRNATVRALEDSQLLCLSRSDFEATVRAHTGLADYFRELVTIRYRGAPGQHLLLPDPIATVMPAIGTRRRKRYWLTLLAGVLVFALLTGLAHVGAGPAAVYAVLAVGSLIGPLVFVQYLAESNILRERPAELAATALLGAGLGLPLAIVVQQYAGLTPDSLLPAVLIALIEEPAKLLGVLWILGQPSLRFRMDGLIYGAAAGMGFAAFETALYGLARVDFVAALLGTLWLRAVLSPFTHGTWTAIVAATVVRQHAAGQAHGVPRVIGAFGCAVVLHSLWNWRPFDFPLSLAWLLLVGATSVILLRTVMHQAVREETTSVLALAPEVRDLPPASAGTLKCLGCGRTAPAGVHYCPRCGLALRRPTAH
jgi:CRP-like cAMP-binding protein